MSSDIDITDSSGNPLYLFRTQPEYSVTRFIHDWTTYEWNNGKVDYTDNLITENTRATFPLKYLPNVQIPAYINVHPKNIIFLTCDAFGL